MRYLNLLCCAALAACSGFDDTDFVGGSGGGVVTGTDFCAVEAIFEEECVACHGQGASGGLNLVDDAYSALVNVISAVDSTQTLVVPGDSANSLLYTMMAGTQPNGLSPMPLGGSINLDYAEVVRIWIDDGAEPCGCDTGEMPSDSGEASSDTGSAEGGEQ